MALQVIDVFNLQIDIGGGYADVQSEVDGLTITVAGDTVDGRTGATGLWKFDLASMKGWSMGGTAKCELGANKLAHKLWQVFSTASRTMGVKFNAQDAATGADNPEWSGTVVVNEVPGIGATVGEIPGGSFTWVGQGALTRATV